MQSFIADFRLCGHDAVEATGCSSGGKSSDKVPVEGAERLASCHAHLQVDRHTEVAAVRGYAPAAVAFILGIFNKSLVFLLIAEVEALRNHIAQVFCMYARAAFQIKLWVCDGHD